MRQILVDCLIYRGLPGRSKIRVKARRRRRAPQRARVRENDAMADADMLRVPFSLRSISGLISVSVTANTDPRAIGYSLLTGGLPVDAARGFPVCRATVTYPAQGYAAVFGWTQMVRSADSAPGKFEMDPISRPTPCSPATSRRSRASAGASPSPPKTSASRRRRPWDRRPGITTSAC